MFAPKKGNANYQMVALPVF